MGGKGEGREWYGWGRGRQGRKDYRQAGRKGYRKEGRIIGRIIGRKEGL